DIRWREAAGRESRNVFLFSLDDTRSVGVDQPILRFHAAPQSRPVGVKVGEELTAKLLQSDHLMRMENDVMEPKRKRSFPINNVPLDRLSISSMETKQQGKVVESPRRRLNPPPIDRIGMGRLPNGRG
uniref:Osteocrin n=1 Tax=Astatotilapia calliptera TaxID=8154 RepID=A0A3P8PKE6_ASTCA